MTYFKRSHINVITGYELLLYHDSQTLPYHRFAGYYHRKCKWLVISELRLDISLLGVICGQ